MRSYLTYYFAGVTTAGVALVVGFGGALVFSNAVLSKKPLPPTKIERVAKSLPQDELLQTKKDFPAQAAPVIAIPQLPQPTEMATITARVSEEPTHVVQAEQSGTLSTASTATEHRRPHREQEQSEAPAFPVTASVNTVAAHPRQEGTTAVPKRRRELEMKNIRRPIKADSTRHAAKQKKDIAAAAEAVRRMLRDRQDLRENGMERSFNIGFSSD